ncbi:MAG: hypothetical protein A2381_03990 [Bdellovibrionales bacterium RIFOXYB1_FULL_37_110]|nr:MAG: hypothetical protein A2417_10100 [Bdellovibrionales bacterium RIFOXYC1_FULL_37_79]OFZ59085.1 MAG: hypothetical protein A2381_03990 [Bdellovibrionales bacterium RIFOXYB1_FULL_37_110]OFZ64092.1 MAG: hypothetical protein A2577_15110 [Bdellovibrionales bacterium RIFOXYD1_FULL_36_51]
MGSDSYLKILSSAVARAVEIPFTCYLYLKINNRYVAYIRKGDIPSEKIINKINTSIQSGLFIKSEDIDAYNEFINNDKIVSEKKENENENENKQLNTLGAEIKKDIFISNLNSDPGQFNISFNHVFADFARTLHTNEVLNFSNNHPDFQLDFDLLCQALKPKLQEINFKDPTHLESELIKALYNPESNLWRDIFKVTGIFNDDSQEINIVKGKFTADNQEKTVVEGNIEEKQNENVLVKGKTFNNNPQVIIVKDHEAHKMKEDIVRIFGEKIESEFLPQLIKNQENEEDKIFRSHGIYLNAAINSTHNIKKHLADYSEKILDAKKNNPEEIESVGMEFYQSLLDEVGSTEETLIKLRDDYHSQEKKGSLFFSNQNQSELNHHISSLVLLQDKCGELKNWNNLNSDKTGHIDGTPLNKIENDTGDLVIALRGIIKKQKEAIAFYNKENTKLKNEITQKQDEKDEIASLKDQIQQLKAQIAQQEKQIQDQNQLVNDLDSELSSKMEELEKNKSQISQNDIQIKEFEDFVFNHTEYIGNIEKENQNIQKLYETKRNEVDDLKKEIRNWEARMQELEILLKEHQDKNTDLKHNIADLNFNESYLKGQIAKLQEIITNFNENPNESISYAQSNKSLTNMLKDHEERYEKESEKLKILKSRIEMLENEKTARDVQDEQINKLRRKLSDNLDLIEEKNKIFIQQEESAQAKITMLQNHNEQNRATIQRLTRFHEKLKTQHAEMIQKLNTNNEHTPDYKKLLNDVSVELSNNKLMLSQLEKRFSNVSQEKKDLQAKYNDALKKIKLLEFNLKKAS